MIEVCSNKEVEKTLQSGVDRRLQPEAGNFLSYSVQERNITIMNEQNNSAFYLSFLGNLGFQVCFIPFLLSYESNSDVSLFFFFFFFFFAKQRMFYFILKSALFHETGRFSQKIQTWSFQLEISNKEKDKKELAGIRIYFFSRFCRINIKRS